MDAFAPLISDHLVTIMGPQTSTPDGSGGTTLSWPAIRQANVACIINAPMLGEQDRFEAANLIGEVTVALFYNQVQRGDLLVVAKGPPYQGAQLRVTGIKAQGGIEALGFPDQFPVVHIRAEHVLVVL